MSLDSWLLWQRSEVLRKLRVFMAESARRCIVKERRIRRWQRDHALEESMIFTGTRPR